MENWRFVIALVGSPGSGKTTAAEYLVTKGFTLFSISEVRRTVGLAFDIDANDFDAMQKFTDDFYAKRGRGVFAEFALRNIASRKVGRIVLEGLRYSESVDVTRMFCSTRGWGFLCVGLEVESDLAAKRIATRARPRDPQTPAAINKYATVAGRNASEALEKCDVIIANDGTIDQLLEKIGEVTEQAILKWTAENNHQ